jgi:pyroglutamyl-peptidase
MALNILLTGFGPFPGAPFNPSARLAERLARRRRPALADTVRTVHVFTTSYAAVDRDVAKLLAQRFDIVLMFGLAGRTPHLRVETRARNARAAMPDAGGHRPQPGAIARGAPPSVMGRSSFRRLLQAAVMAKVPARLSRDAGRYLCNYSYWRALEATADGKTRVQFIHIPLVRRNPMPRARARRRGPTLEDLVRAGEAMLIALIAARR